MRALYWLAVVAGGWLLGLFGFFLLYLCVGYVWGVDLLADDSLAGDLSLLSCSVVGVFLMVCCARLDRA